MKNYYSEIPKSQPFPKYSPLLPAGNEQVGEGETRSGSLLYLYSNNSIENTLEKPLNDTTDKHRAECVNALMGVLSPYYKKSAETLHLNVKRLVNGAPSIGHILFLTLTFPDNVKDPKEAYKRFRSMNSNFLSGSPKFKEWICTKERQKRGAWHFHLLIQVEEDCKTGFDWILYGEALKLRDHSAPYRSPKNTKYRQAMTLALKTASPYLRNLWKELRAELPKYGFGRSECLPIRSNEDAMARYVGKYIGKHIGAREIQDKGVRLVTYSKNWVKNSAKFQWNTDGAKEWRRKLNLFAKIMGCNDMYDLNRKIGSSWAYHYAEDIMAIDETIFKSGCEPEKMTVESLPEPMVARMEKHSNAREAKKIKTCPVCERKSARKWQENNLYCLRCGGLVF